MRPHESQRVAQEDAARTGKRVEGKKEKKNIFYSLSLATTTTQLLPDTVKGTAPSSNSNRWPVGCQVTDIILLARPNTDSSERTHSAGQRVNHGRHV